MDKADRSMELREQERAAEEVVMCSFCMNHYLLPDTLIYDDGTVECYMCKRKRYDSSKEKEVF